MQANTGMLDVLKYEIQRDDMLYMLILFLRRLKN